MSWEIFTKVIEDCKDFEGMGLFIALSKDGEPLMDPLLFDKIKYIKDNLFDIPPIFKLIQSEGNIEWEEMYKVFNMGHRMEIMCETTVSDDIISASRDLGVDAKIIGRVEKETKDKANTLVIETENGTFNF